MNDSAVISKTEVLQCPLKGHWVSFRLVDENGDGKPYAGLPYTLHDSQDQTREGSLDSEGHAKVEGIYCGPVVLNISSLDDGGLDPWYKLISIRDNFTIPLTAIQVAAEQTPTGPRHADGQTYLAKERAQREKASFMRVEVRDFAEATAHLPDADAQWSPKPSANLKQNSGAAKEQLGVALKPNIHYVLEVKALRAYSPMLSRAPEFCALNAYHLAVFSAFVYAPFSQPKQKNYKSLPPPYSASGSIGNALRELLPKRIKPTQFNSANYDLICEEVPYSKRLEVMPYDPERYADEAGQGWNNPEDVHFLYHEDTETQAFITHNDKVILISLRGTQEKQDILRDIDARQVPYTEGDGQAHRGFYEAFLAAKKFTQRYLDAFHRPDHCIVICGHSLGGAIALLLAEWVRRQWSDNVQLYTFGSPRAGDRAFVQGAAALTHHRLVNHNDPVPGVPFTWMDAEWKLALPGTVALFSSPLVGIALLLGGLLNLRGDPYEHHGEQRHFMPRKPNASSEVAILWQPGCAAIDEQVCASYAGAVDLENDMPKRKSLIGQALSAAEHSSDAGYSRAMLTTLLRWNASVANRNGELFTASELQDIRNQVEQVEQQLANWQPRSFFEFRHIIRAQHDTRFYGKSELELRQMYHEGITLARQLTKKQREELIVARSRLLNQAQRPLTLTDVFGDQAQNPELEKLVSEWRAIDANAQAELLAKVPSAGAKLYA
ncbi:lipase family protein [Pseudomonas sp. 5P_3.1_Bac2]|uniref:lipase family protein n=1 Tax=Pseudomonas sp. 5P_3.1_Bac2 TaxID=2971617 RepID=UPI0021C636CE|nr:lipase family protein [Pseudomonas sp. 5P_3.1_Bac2]MCU1718976.1 lipase family protein [Pseudomonas sp. 5P_3.1_Bac2]